MYDRHNNNHTGNITHKTQYRRDAGKSSPINTGVHKVISSPTFKIELPSIGKEVRHPRSKTKMKGKAFTVGLFKETFLMGFTVNKVSGNAMKVLPYCGCELFPASSNGWLVCVNRLKSKDR